MTNARSDLSVSRLELLMLARLSNSKSVNDEQLANLVRDFALPSKNSNPEQIAAQTLSELRQRGFVQQPTKRGLNRKLTELGVRALRTGFDLDKLPTWAEFHNTYLLAHVLGVPADKDVKSATKDSNKIASLIVRKRYNVNRPSDVADQMIAEALGLPAGPVTIARLRAHMLTKHVGATSTLTPKQVLVKLAEHVIGEASPNKKAMSRVLVRRWVYEVTGTKLVTGPQVTSGQAKPSFSSSSSITTNGNAVKSSGNGHATALRTPEPRDPEVLLRLVREAIPRVGADGRIGPEKVFVSALWHRIERDSRLPNLSLDHFKHWLITANRDQLISLARADAPGTMDPRLVAESEIEDRGATFHFVVDQRTHGARGAHAR